MTTIHNSEWLQIDKMIIFDCDDILLPDFEMDKYKLTIERFSQILQIADSFEW